MTLAVTDADVIGYVPAEQPTEAELDAIDVMWMERLAKPWHPTPTQPIRPIRCTGIVRNEPRKGRRCGGTSILGATVCPVHGGQLPPVKEAALRRVESVRLRLYDDLNIATDTLEDLMLNSTSDAVRLKAVEIIFERTGLRGGAELDVVVSDSADPSTNLRDRLLTLAKRTVIDIEPAEQPALPQPDDTV